MGKLSHTVKSWLAAPTCPTTLASLRIAFALLAAVALGLALQESQWLGGPLQSRPYLWMDWMAGKSTESARGFLCLGLVFAITSLLGLLTPFSLLGLWLVLVNLRNHLAWGVSEGGLQVVQCAILCLLWTPCGQRWSWDARMGWWRGQSLWGGPIRVLQLLQVVIYLESGWYKLMGREWWQGKALLMVSQNYNFSRLAAWAPAEGGLLAGLMSLATWLVLFWELTFPLWLLWRPTRRLAIAVGIAMHMGLWLFFDVGLYPPAMIALYLIYLPGRPVGHSPAPSRAKRLWVGLHAGLILWAALPVHKVYPVDPQLQSPLAWLGTIESAAYEVRASALRASPVRAWQALVDNLGLNHRYNTFSPNPPNLSVFFRLRDDQGRLVWSDAPGEGLSYSWTGVIVRSLATTSPQALPLFFQMAWASHPGLGRGLVLEEWFVELGQPLSTQTLNQRWSWSP